MIIGLLIAFIAGMVVEHFFVHGLVDKVKQKIKGWI